MTEKQKTYMGILYRADDEHLIAERNYAKGITKEYNQSHPDGKDYRSELMHKLFGELGEKAHIEAPFYCNYGYRISIGRNFFSNFNVTILDGGQVTIGDNVYLAPNVGIYTASHPTDSRRRNLGYEWALPVVIGNNVWIGGNASIMPGVTIGNNVTIGAGSVVTKDIPDNVVAAGNPCKVIRKVKEGDLNGLINEKDGSQSIQQRY